MNHGKKNEAALSGDLVQQQRDSDQMVEMGGIEPPSTAVILRLLRAYPVDSLYSAPTFATGI
jgi:hypothetical protein